MSVSFEMKLAVQWASRNLHRFDRRWKKCEREMWRSWRRNAQEASPDKRCPLKATAVWCYLCFPLTSSADLTSRLCPSSVHLFLFLQILQTLHFLCLPLMTIPSPSFSPSILPPSHQLLRHCVSLVLPLHWPGCITTPSPSNGFPMLRPSYLSCGHVSLLGSIAL